MKKLIAVILLGVLNAVILHFYGVNTLLAINLPLIIIGLASIEEKIK